MSIIKSFSVSDYNEEKGDMFYIQHGTSNFTIIDCCLNDETKEQIVNEINEMKSGKDIIRFISTHPDEDHISGLEYLDSKIRIPNFYCVENQAIKEDESNSFKYYCGLRDDSDKHFYVFNGCKRKWMNLCDNKISNDYGSSGINFLWPITSNVDYKKELQKANEGISFNNISPIFTYSIENGVKVMWMGDIEHDFLEKIKDEIDWPEIDILFAPHHGRESGKVSSDVLAKLNPQIIIIGEAPSKYLDYYENYNTITQNSAGNIVFYCVNGKVQIYVSNETYSVDFLNTESSFDSSLGKYLGSFDTKEYD